MHCMRRFADSMLENFEARALPPGVQGKRAFLGFQVDTFEPRAEANRSLLGHASMYGTCDK